MLVDGFTMFQPEKNPQRLRDPHPIIRFQSPAAPGTAWHPLLRGTAWQSRSGGPPACACALDMRPGPQMMFCLTIELSSTNRTVKATDLLFGGPFL